MPNIKKTVKFQKEQQEVIDLLVKALHLNDDNSFVLYDIDSNEEILKELDDISLKVKKYFNCNWIGGVKQKDKIKRPWLSMVRQVLKNDYKLITTDYRLYQDDKVIRTRKYFVLTKSD